MNDKIWKKKRFSYEFFFGMLDIETIFYGSERAYIYKRIDK